MITAKIAGCNECDWREGPAESAHDDMLFALAKNHYIFSGRRHTVYLEAADCEISELKTYPPYSPVEQLPQPKLDQYGG